MSIQDIIDSIPTDLEEGTIITRKWVKGKVVEETREKVDWKPNAADLDLVTVQCECGNSYTTPWDTLMFLNDKYSFCGQCGESGKMKVVK